MSSLSLPMKEGLHKNSTRFGGLHIGRSEDVASILQLVDEGSFTCLLDLETKEECELPHHAHLKFLLRRCCTFLAQDLISSTKTNKNLKLFFTI